MENFGNLHHQYYYDIFFKNLRAFQQKNLFCDLQINIININENMVFCHSIVLAANSSKIAQELYNSNGDMAVYFGTVAGMFHTAFANLDYDLAMTMIDFLYGGKCDLQRSKAEAFRMCAEILGIDVLCGPSSGLSGTPTTELSTNVEDVYVMNEADNANCLHYHEIKQEPLDDFGDSIYGEGIGDEITLEDPADVKLEKDVQCGVCQEWLNEKQLHNHKDCQTRLISADTRSENQEIDCQTRTLLVLDTRLDDQHQAIMDSGDTRLPQNISDCQMMDNEGITFVKDKSDCQTMDDQDTTFVKDKSDCQTMDNEETTFVKDESDCQTMDNEETTFVKDESDCQTRMDSADSSQSLDEIDKISFQCGECHALVDSVELLEKHETMCCRKSENVEKPKQPKRKKFACFTCNIEFKSNKGLMCHKAKKKCGYKCHTCDKRFHSNTYLKKHLSVHSDRRKQYECHLCGKKYLHATSLKHHLDVEHKEVHTDTSAKPQQNARLAKKSMAQGVKEFLISNFEVADHKHRINGVTVRQMYEKYAQENNLKKDVSSYALGYQIRLTFKDVKYAQYYNKDKHGKLNMYKGLKLRTSSTLSMSDKMSICASYNYHSFAISDTHTVIKSSNVSIDGVCMVKQIEFDDDRHYVVKVGGKKVREKDLPVTQVDSKEALCLLLEEVEHFDICLGFQEKFYDLLEPQTWTDGTEIKEIYRPQNCLNYVKVSRTHHQRSSICSKCKQSKCLAKQQREDWSKPVHQDHPYCSIAPKNEAATTKELDTPKDDESDEKVSHMNHLNPTFEGKKSLQGTEHREDGENS